MWLKETDNVLSQFINYVILSDILVLHRELTKAIVAIKVFFS